MKEDLAKLRNARSRKDYPSINLVENEYVEMCVRRSKIIPILVNAGIVLAAFILIAVITIMNAGEGNFAFSASSKAFMSLVALIVFGAIVIVALIYNHVYNGNVLYITNKRLIQVSMESLFSKSTNVIDLVSVEDVSFRQSGLFEKIFRLGTMRMSTVGDETTYTFKYVDTPNDELETITHLVHDQKNQNDDERFQDAVRREVQKQIEEATPEINPETIEEPDEDDEVQPPKVNTDL